MSKNWTYNEGKALISVYGSRKEEYFKTRNKKHFWENVLTDLEALNILVSATTVENVEVKWRSLQRAYKNAKDRGTGTTATKFLYMEEMEELFQTNPIMSSPHSVSVGMESQPEPAPMTPMTSNDTIVSSDVEIAEPHSSRLSKKKKRQQQDSKEALIEIKRKYYEEKIAEKRKKTALLEKYFEKKEQDREERKHLILSLLNK